MTDELMTRRALAMYRLFDVRDYEAKARELAGLGQRDDVHLLADTCFVAHGRTFDADLVLKQAGVA